MNDDKFGFGRSSDLLEDLNDMVSDWTGCTDCDLHHERRSQVWFRMEGAPEPGGLMLIGPSPGREDDQAGEPFIGPAGAKLNRLLEEAAIKNIFLTNTLLCAPPGKRNPRVPELRSCWPRLQRTIEIMRPKVIITAGRFASHWLLETATAMNEMSMNIYQWELGEIFTAKIVPMYHPEYLLKERSASIDRIVIDRLALARKLSE